MTEKEKAFCEWCAAHNPHKFYKSTAWEHCRDEVLRLDRYECQMCKTKYKRYRRADTVHHVNHFRDRPDIALCVYTTDPATHKEVRNLVSLCHACHEEVHGYRKQSAQQPPLTEERWD